jgi:hypothetical protein
MSGVLGPASYLTPEFKLYAPYDTGVSPIPGPTGGVAVVSPLVIKSKDGLSESSISVLNVGATVLTTAAGDVLTTLNDNTTINSKLFITDKLTVQPSDPTAAANLTLGNGSNNANYGIFVASQTGEGLNENDFQIYGYPSTGGNYPIIDANVQGTAIELGSSLAPDGCNVQINGAQGVSRVFDGLYNPPTLNNIITFDSQRPVLSPTTAMGDFGSGNWGNFLVRQANSAPISFVMPTLKSGCDSIVVSVNVPGAGFQSGATNSMGYLDLFDATANVAIPGKFYSFITPSYFPTTQAPGANYQQNLTMSDVFSAPTEGHTIQVRLLMVQWGSNLTGGITLYSDNAFAIVKVEPAIDSA